MPAIKRERSESPNRSATPPGTPPRSATPPMPKHICKTSCPSSPTNQHDAHATDRIASILMDEMLHAEDVLHAQLQQTAVQDNLQFTTAHGGKQNRRNMETPSECKVRANSTNRPLYDAPHDEQGLKLAGSSRTLDEQALEQVLQEASAGFSQQASQADLNERSRGIAMLVKMKKTFDLSPSTFMLSVSLYDRFLNTYQCDRLASESKTNNHRDLRPSAAGMKRVCAPLACLVMANKFMDVLTMCLSDLIMSVQQIFRAQSEADDSTNIGEFGLYERWPVHEMRTEDLREWEQIVWKALGYRLDHVTALDVLHALLQCMSKPMRRLIEDTSELKVQAAVCCPSSRDYSPVDLATASLLHTASRLSVSDAQEVKDVICRAIPAFRITQDVRSCQALINRLHVTV